MSRAGEAPSRPSAGWPGVRVTGILQGGCASELLGGRRVERARDASEREQQTHAAGFSPSPGNSSRSTLTPTRPPSGPTASAASAATVSPARSTRPTRHPQGTSGSVLTLTRRQQPGNSYHPAGRSPAPAPPDRPAYPRRSSRTGGRRPGRRRGSGRPGRHEEHRQRATQSIVTAPGRKITSSPSMPTRTSSPAVPVIVQPARPGSTCASTTVTAEGNTNITHSTQPPQQPSRGTPHLRGASPWQKPSQKLRGTRLASRKWIRTAN